MSNEYALMRHELMWRTLNQEKGNIMNDPIASSSIPRAAMQAVDDQEAEDNARAKAEAKKTEVLASVKSLSNVNRKQRQLAQAQIEKAEAERNMTLELAQQVLNATISAANSQYHKDVSIAERDYREDTKEANIIVEATTEFIHKVNQNSD